MKGACGLDGDKGEKVSGCLWVPQEPGRCLEAAALWLSPLPVGGSKEMAEGGAQPCSGGMRSSPQPLALGWALGGTGLTPLPLFRLL